MRSPWSMIVLLNWCFSHCVEYPWVPQAQNTPVRAKSALRGIGTEFHGLTLACSERMWCWYDTCTYTFHMQEAHKARVPVRALRVTWCKSHLPSGSSCKRYDAKARYSCKDKNVLTLVVGETFVVSCLILFHVQLIMDWVLHVKFLCCQWLQVTGEVMCS